MTMMQRYPMITFSEPRQKILSPFIYTISSMNNNYFDQFFAKSDGVTTLTMHTQHVVTAGRNLLLSLPLTQEEREFWNEKLVRVAVLHDLGKIHKAFVGRLAGQEVGDIRHELISLLLCINYLTLEDDELFAIATHHKGVVDTHLQTKGTLSINQIVDYITYWYEADSSIFESENIQLWLRIFELKLDVIQQETVKELPKNIKMYLNAKYQ